MTFENAYRRYGGYIYRLCRNRMRDRHLAEDLAAETWLTAWQVWARCWPGHERAWLVGIAHNRCAMYWRTQAAAERWRGRGPSYNPIEDTRTTPDTSLDRLLAQEVAQQVQAAFARLPPDHRTALHLAITGADQDTMARLLGRNVNAVKQLLWRARGAMRRQLGA